MRKCVMHNIKVPTPKVRGQNRVSAITKKLLKLHRKIKHNEKVCRAHDLDS